MVGMGGLCRGVVTIGGMCRDVVGKKGGDGV